MRIGLNLLHALPEIGGGWNYIESLVKALGDYGENHTYIAFVHGESSCLVPNKPNFTKVAVRLNAKSRILRIAYESTALQILAKRYSLDCMHWFGCTMGLYNSTPGVVTVYDLHAFSPFSRNTAWLKRVYLQKMIGHAGRRASMLLPMSQITAADLTKYIGVPEERMRVIPAILEPGFQRSEVRDVEQFRNRFGLPEHFWAYVAHLYPHKNHVKLLEAYSQLKRNGVNPWKMILRGNPAGGEEQVYRTIKELELADDIIWLPRLTQGDMANLYSAASGLVFPSKYEGGGIPVLEALGCGCPIIAADLPSLREFGGDAVSYFNPDSSAAIAESMKQFQSSNENREKRRQIGLARAEGFRAKQIIPRLIESYECCRKDDSSRHEPRKEIRAAGCVGRN